MSDLIVEASRAIVPLLADGAVGELARRAGDGVAATARRVIDVIRGTLPGEEPTEAEVADALRTGLREGTLGQGDLTQLVQVHGAVRDNNGVQVKGNAYFDASIKIDGGGSFNG